MGSLFMVGAVALLSLAATPKVTTFEKQRPLLEDGKLTPAGKSSILKALNARPSENHQVMLEICTGAEQPVSGRAGAWLGRLIAAELKKTRGRELEWVVRERDREACPNHFVVRSLALPSRDARSIARVVSASGKVAAELPDGRTLALGEASIVPANSTVSVAGGACQMVLPDGSTVRVLRDTRIRVDALQSSKTQRKVALRLFAGEVWARITSAISDNSRWEIETDNAVAGIRGTELSMTSRIDDTSPVSDLFVYEGRVELASKKGKPVVVASGSRGLVVDTETPRIDALAAPPRQLSPVQGSFSSPVSLRWTSDETGARYRVQLARDVEFTDVAYEYSVTETTVEAAVDPGSYFWRVLTLKEDGNRSFPSQLYRIAVE